MVNANIEAAIPLVPTEEERAIRESVSQIASKYGPEYYLEKVKVKTPMTELIQELGQAGFLGVHLPEEYGGGGLGLYDLCMVLDETARQGCPIAALVYSVGIAAPIIARHATEGQKAEWIPQLASGETQFSFAITEPDAGSNSHNIKTAAKKVGDKFVINGQKVFITGLDYSQKVLVVAKTGTDEKTGRGQLSLFVVDSDAPGISKKAIPTFMNIPDHSFQVFFDNVEVPEERLIGELHKGLKPLFSGLNPERILTGTNTLGVGRYALDKAVKYANERNVWGVTIGRHQGVAHQLAEAKVELEVASLMLKKAALLHDNNLEAGETANMAKLAAGDAAIKSIERAIGVHGGNGITMEYQLAYYWPMARMSQIGPVSREMVLNYVAEHSLGLGKSY